MNALAEHVRNEEMRQEREAQIHVEKIQMANRLAKRLG